MFFDVSDACVIKVQFGSMLLPVFFLVPGIKKLSLGGLVCLVLSDEMNLLIQFLDSVLSGTERFSCFVQLGRNIIQFGGKIFTGIISLFLNITHGSGHFLQIGNLHFPCICGTLLCLDIGLQIYDESQVLTNEENRNRIGMIIVIVIIFRKPVYSYP